MLQRAASNAYSWWMASHIRTNQSKWLDSDLQDMEERVQAMLKIIEEDADSFARRAEMYYKRRPELINFVEETYRAYRSLAERYDRISGELHKANHTLATAFPDLQFPMQDEDDDGPPSIGSPSDSIEVHRPPPPELPQFSIMNKRSENKPAPKKTDRLKSKSQPRKAASHINESEANEAIDRLQKGILVLQTEKEFIKSSYETGVAKYWEIEKQITEMQEEVTFLQDEFSASAVIEDEEARSLMAVTALKSCNDTLFNLQEQQRRSIEETHIESERIKIAREKLKALKGGYGQREKEVSNVSDNSMGISATTSVGGDVCDMQQESLELDSICEKFKDQFEINYNTSVVELAEKIDELVNKVISLELTVSSQTAQIRRLRSETDDLQKHLHSLEEERVSMVDDSNSLNDRLKQAEEELHKIQNLEKCVKHEKGVLHSDFTEACHSLSNISGKLQSPKHQDQVEIADLPRENRSLPRIESQKNSKEKESMKIQSVKVEVEKEMKHSKDQENTIQSHLVPQLEIVSGESRNPKQEDGVRERDLSKATDSNPLTSDLDAQSEEPEDASNLAQLLLNGLEGREKTLLAEYTSILRSYRETKRKLLEVEKKNQEYFSETMTQVKELKNANAVKDDEIRSLRQMLGSLQTNSKLWNSELSENQYLEASKKKDTYSKCQGGGSLNAGEGIKLGCTDEPQTMSPIEEKFRRDIDTLLDENLEFWLRFSTSFHQIQKFRTDFQNLQADIEKLKDSKTQEGSNRSAEQAGRPESAPIDKQMRELKTELQVWVEQNALLRGELQSRFSSLCNIQEEITAVLKESAEADHLDQFTPLQAAKFQGEVLNMKQENNKVADELQAGLDHVKALQSEVENTLSTLSELHEKIELSTSKSGNHHNHHFRHFSSKSKGVPLRSFLYGAKPKKPSIFSCMNPALQKQYSDLRAGMPI